MSTPIPIPQAQLGEFCQRWQITELALFGSVLLDDFRPDSDVDILVRFAEASRHTLFDLSRMEAGLQTIFGREVDLVIVPVVGLGPDMHVPAQFRENHPEVPWSEMRGMRNQMIHHYDDVDLHIVWHTVQDDIFTTPETA